MYYFYTFIPNPHLFLLNLSGAPTAAAFSSEPDVSVTGRYFRERLSPLLRIGQIRDHWKGRLSWNIRHPPVSTAVSTQAEASVEFRFPPQPDFQGSQSIRVCRPAGVTACSGELRSPASPISNEREKQRRYRCFAFHGRLETKVRHFRLG